MTTKVDGVFGLVSGFWIFLRLYSDSLSPLDYEIPVFFVNIKDRI